MPVKSSHPFHDIHGEVGVAVIFSTGADVADEAVADFLGGSAPAFGRASLSNRVGVRWSLFLVGGDESVCVGLNVQRERGELGWGEHRAKSSGW